ncbi:hypothetical protein EH11_04128 [Bacillus subtilis]|uniref:hypothetical protein n=1 Tax=Bacillus subtilis TaxID=1423 RepID=UPI000F534595|nr:hypothetical protein [Bacillus subtilis]RPJ98048.1 hypothetical protein EH11_04128 [Bacillus subtilis]RUS03613.1 hypothetical protein EFW59_04210 [Bacillus subtilis]
MEKNNLVESESLRAYIDEISKHYLDQVLQIFEQDQYSCPCLLYDEQKRDYTLIKVGTQSELDNQISDNPHLIAVSVKQFDNLFKKYNEASITKALEEMKTILHIDLMYRYKRVEYQNNEIKLIRSLRQKNGLPIEEVCVTYQPPKVFEECNF